MFRAAVAFLTLAVLIAGARIYATHFADRHPHEAGWTETSEVAGEVNAASTAGQQTGGQQTGEQKPQASAKRGTRVSFLVPDARDLLDALKLDQIDEPAPDKPQFGPRRDDKPPATKSATTVKIQSQLRRVGCYLGYETGQWDRGTKRAMTRFSRATKRRLNALAPTKTALQVLQRAKGQICFSKLAKIKKPVSAFAVDDSGAAPGRRASRTAPAAGGGEVAGNPSGKPANSTSRPPAIDKAIFAVKKAQTVREFFPTAPSDAAKLAALNTRDLTISLQKQLIRIGCYDGAVDGLWQGPTRRALVRFNRFTETQLATDRPSRAAVEAIKLRKGDICLMHARKREQRLAELRAEKELEEKPVSLKLLAGDGSLRSSNDTASEPDMRSPEAVRGYLAVLIKTQLRRVGCFHGKIASTWDAAAQDAMVLFNYYGHTQLPIDVPARQSLKALSQTQHTVCPIGCFIKGNGADNPDDGRCIKPQARGTTRSLEAGQDAVVEPTHSQLPKP